MDQPQEGNDVLDLAPGVEAGGPDQPVGQACANEGILEGAGLGIGAVHHGAVTGTHALLSRQLSDGVDDEPGLLVLIVGLVDGDLGPTPPAGEERLVRAVGVVLDDCAGSVEYGLGGAIVSLQEDRHEVGMIISQTADVAIVRPPPGIDRLILVGDAEEVVVATGELAQQRVLGLIGVLELVHQDVPVPLLVLRQHVWAAVERAHRHHQQVVEVEPTVGLQKDLIALVDPLDDLAVVGASGIGARRDQLVLGAGDGAVHRLGAVLLVVQVQVADGLPDQAELVVGIEDGVVAGDTGRIGLTAQDAGTSGVEGAQREATTARRTDKPLQSLPHLAGRLVGEGDGHDTPGGDAELPHQPGDAVGEHAGLATARPGQHQHRAIGGGDGFLLLGVQSLEEIHDAGL